MSFSFTYDFNFLLRPFWHEFFSGMTFVAWFFFTQVFQSCFFWHKFFKNIFMHILFHDVFRMTVFATIIFGRLFWEWRFYQKVLWNDILSHGFSVKWFFPSRRPSMASPWLYGASIVLLGSILNIKGPGFFSMSLDSL